MSYRTMRVIILALLMTGLAATFPGTVSAARAETKIAVVDFQRILTESKAGQALQKQLDAQQHGLQDEIAKQEEDLQQAQDNLNKEPDAAKASDEFVQKKAEFEKKVLATKLQVQKKRAALEKSAEAAIADLRNQAGEVVGTIATTDKYDLVLTRQAVLMANKSFDITDRVLKALDAKVTKIDLKTGDTAAAPAPAKAKTP